MLKNDKKKLSTPFMCLNFWAKQSLKFQLHLIFCFLINVYLEYIFEYFTELTESRVEYWYQKIRKIGYCTVGL